jgi:hypothetical protein
VIFTFCAEAGNAAAKNSAARKIIFAFPTFPPDRRLAADDHRRCFAHEIFAIQSPAGTVLEPKGAA